MERVRGNLIALLPQINRGEVGIDPVGRIDIQ